MDKAGMLCSADRELLHDFSRRSLARMQSRSLIPLQFPVLRAFTAANVEKEAEKDRLVIEHAAACVREGREVGETDVQDLFERSRSVDSAFLRKVSIPFISISVRYDDIRHIREKRIGLLLRCVHILLASWPDGETVEEAARNAFAEKEFRSMLAEMLHLYNQETLMLGRSIELIGPLQGTAAVFADALYHVMEEATGAMIDSCAERIYGRTEGSCR